MYNICSFFFFFYTFKLQQHPQGSETLITVSERSRNRVKF